MVNARKALIKWLRRLGWPESPAGDELPEFRKLAQFETVMNGR